MAKTEHLQPGSRIDTKGAITLSYEHGLIGFTDAQLGEALAEVMGDRWVEQLKTMKEQGKIGGVIFNGKLT